VLGLTGITASILMLARIPRDSAPELTAQAGGAVD
jgi:hypothetical protein